MFSLTSPRQYLAERGCFPCKAELPGHRDSFLYFPLWRRGADPAAARPGGVVTQLRLQAVLDALDADLAWLAGHRESLQVADPRLPGPGRDRALTWATGRLAALGGLGDQRTCPTTSIPRLETRCPRSSARCWTSSVACSCQRWISTISAIRT